MYPESTPLPAAKEGRAHPVGLLLLLVAGAVILGWCVARYRVGSSSRNSEVVAALLADVGVDAIIPNDVYGHLHDELEESLELGSWPDAQESPIPAVAALLPGPAPETASARALREAGGDVGEVLLVLLMARPTTWERMREHLGIWLPIPALRFSAGVAAGRRRMAGLIGFGIVGERGARALPGLSNLLYHAGASMEVGLALGGLGEAGRSQLIAALASPDAQVRGTAALALGLEGARDRRVLPALLSALDQGYVDYHILGAIGRLGGDSEATGLSVSKALLREGGPPPCSMEQRMLVCLAGLCGPHAAPALPALERRRMACDESHRVLIERAIQRIAPPVSPAKIGARNRN